MMCKTVKNSKIYDLTDLKKKERLTINKQNELKENKRNISGIQALHFLSVTTSVL